MLTTIRIKKDERGLLFKDGDFTDILRPGIYRFLGPRKRINVERQSLASTQFNHKLANYLTQAEPMLVEREFHQIVLGPSQVGLRYENDILVEVVPPNTRRLYWKGYIDVRHEMVDISTEYRLGAVLTAQIAQARVKVAGSEGVFSVQVPQYHVALLYVDGRLSEVLQAGVHAWFRYGRDLRSELVDLRLQAVDVAGQEILTRDKVSLRVNLTAGYRISDVQLAFSRHAKPLDYLYRELQFGLRAAVGTRTLDELLENKHVIDEVVGAHIRRRVEGFGLEVESVGVKDIVLPGDMKTILARVVEAEKTAEANVIRRREETAATRSLLNTAKVMEGNPVALRLKELETLERVTEKIDRISVYGGLDSVLKDLVTLRA